MAYRLSILVCAFGLAASPALAAAHCPQPGTAYTVKGHIKNAGTTDDGHFYYDVLAKKCAGTEGVIAAYPPQQVEGCAVGKTATASGTYRKDCSSNDLFGMMCLAKLDNATVTCK